MTEVHAPESVNPPTAPDLIGATFAMGEKLEKAVSPKSPSMMKGDLSSEKPSFKSSWEELQYWGKPSNSALTIAAVTFAYYVVHDGGLITLTCYALIIRLLTVAGGRRLLDLLDSSNGEKTEKGKLTNLVERAVLFVEGQVMVLPSSSQVDGFVSSLGSMVSQLVNKLFRKISEASEPTPKGTATLKVLLGSIVGVLLVTRFFSIVTIAYLVFLHQMLWPMTYANHQEKIDEAYAKAWAKAEPHVEKIKAKLDELYVKLEAKAKEVGAKLAEKGKAQYEQAMAKYKEKMGKATPPAEKPEEKKE